MVGQGSVLPKNRRTKLVISSHDTFRIGSSYSEFCFFIDIEK